MSATTDEDAARLALASALARVNARFASVIDNATCTDQPATVRSELSRLVVALSQIVDKQLPAFESAMRA